MSGAGVVTLTGANSYTGATTVTSGTLTCPARVRSSGTSGLSVSAGGTFNYVSTAASTVTLPTLTLAQNSAVGVLYGDTVASTGSGDGRNGGEN